MSDGVLISRDKFKAIVDAVRWIDDQYANQDLGHQHFRVGAKCKASDALELLFSSQPLGSDKGDGTQ